MAGAGVTGRAPRPSHFSGSARSVPGFGSGLWRSGAVLHLCAQQAGGARGLARLGEPVADGAGSGRAEAPSPVPGRHSAEALTASRGPCRGRRGLCGSLSAAHCGRPTLPGSLPATSVPPVTFALEPLSRTWLLGTQSRTLSDEVMPMPAILTLLPWARQRPLWAQALVIPAPGTTTRVHLDSLALRSVPPPGWVRWPRGLTYPAGASTHVCSRVLIAPPHTQGRGSATATGRSRSSVCFRRGGCEFSLASGWKGSLLRARYVPGSLRRRLIRSRRPACGERCC